MEQRIKLLANALTILNDKAQQIDASTYRVCFSPEMKSEIEHALKLLP